MKDEKTNKPLTLEDLQRDFNLRYQKSGDKELLLKRELSFYELVFDIERRYGGMYSEGPAFPEYFNKFNEILTGNRWEADELKVLREIQYLRLAYLYFVINGNDINEAEKWYRDINKNTKLTEEEIRTGAKHAVSKAILFSNYLFWLRDFSKIKTKKYPDKYYAWYHRILIELEKTEPFAMGANREIINRTGANIGAKSGFYQAFLDFNIKTPSEREKFVNSLSVKDRREWKQKIIDLSNNDIDVINFLRKYFPN